MSINEQKRAIKNNLPVMSEMARKNLFNVVKLQTNDELMESLNRLHLKKNFIDEYMESMNPIVRPISISGVFDANERNGRGIAMTMVYTLLRICKPAVDAAGMGKRALRLRDWDKSKFQYSSSNLNDPTALLNIVYDIRIKKGF